MTFTQARFDIRCEWGGHGIAALAPISDAVIIVDSMSFSTCVSVATGRGALVFPYRYNDDSRFAFARSIGADLAGPRGTSRYSLSPASLLQIPAGTRLVLSSPNGATLTLTTGRTPTFAGCFRNSKVVATAAMRYGGKIAVIAAGERWKDDGTLRPGFGDLIGSGAIIRYLVGTLSPEAQLAVDAFRSAAPSLLTGLRECASGLELLAMGFEEDLAIIAEMDADDCAPIFRDGACSRSES